MLGQTLNSLRKETGFYILSQLNHKTTVIQTLALTLTLILTLKQTYPNPNPASLNPNPNLTLTQL